MSLQYDFRGDRYGGELAFVSRNPGLSKPEDGAKQLTHARSAEGKDALQTIEQTGDGRPPLYCHLTNPRCMITQPLFLGDPSQIGSVNVFCESDRGNSKGEEYLFSRRRGPRSERVVVQHKHNNGHRVSTSAKGRLTDSGTAVGSSPIKLRALKCRLIQLLS